MSTSPSYAGPLSVVGEHTNALLGELGYSGEQIEALVQQSVVAVGNPNSGSGS
jgi:crotonobetainyl-CoA:carnitine CoA-transferase CaiB-like acyl-CoA transferase